MRVFLICLRRFLVSLPQRRRERGVQCGSGIEPEAESTTRGDCRVETRRRGSQGTAFSREVISFEQLGLLFNGERLHAVFRGSYFVQFALAITQGRPLHLRTLHVVTRAHLRARNKTERGDIWLSFLLSQER